VVFPAPFRPRIATRDPLSTATSTSTKISNEPYDLDSPLAVRGVLPHGAGDGKRTFAARSVTRTSSRVDSIRSARRAMFWAATAFVALARILSA
jgi:hypothetical protein